MGGGVCRVASSAPCLLASACPKASGPTSPVQALFRTPDRKELLLGVCWRYGRCGLPAACVRAPLRLAAVGSWIGFHRVGGFCSVTYFFLHLGKRTAVFMF